MAARATKVTPNMILSVRTSSVPPRKYRHPKYPKQSTMSVQIIYSAAIKPGTDRITPLLKSGLLLSFTKKLIKRMAKMLKKLKEISRGIDSGLIPK